jgi:TPR repeat protein
MGQQPMTPRNLTSNQGTPTIDGWETCMRRALISALILSVLLTSAAFAQTGTLGLNAPQLYEKGLNSLLGVGVSRNDLNAVDFFRRSADLGYPQAQVVLGYFYETGSIVPRDATQAAEWYKKAARQDDRLADWLVGRLYYTGNGVPRDLNAAEISQSGRSLWAVFAGASPTETQRLLQSRGLVPQSRHAGSAVSAAASGQASPTRPGRE